MSVTATQHVQHAEVRSEGADEDLERVRQGFLGAIQQEPPMFSAIKVGGERLYAKARRGEVCSLSIVLTLSKCSQGPAYDQMREVNITSFTSFSPWHRLR